MIWARALTGPSGSDFKYCPARFSTSVNQSCSMALLKRAAYAWSRSSALGVLLEVLCEIVDQGSVMAGLDLGDSRHVCLGSSWMMDEREGSNGHGGPVTSGGLHRMGPPSGFGDRFRTGRTDGVDSS